jgi:hypothetical protein
MVQVHSVASGCLLLPLGTVIAIFHFSSARGQCYKHITTVNDASRVVTLQIVASDTIVIDDTS